MQKSKVKSQNLWKIFREGEKAVEVLKGLDFEIGSQQKIGIVGASGVGKSTFLHIIGGLDQPTKGKVLLENEDLYALSEAKRSHLRNCFFGFVFQFYHLLPELTALENVVLPALIAGFSKSEAKKWGIEGLTQVGLAQRGSHLPSELSGGEQQRVALARACLLKPKLILADEPTGNLDQESGQEVLRFLFDIVSQTQGSLILVTHNRDLLKDMDDVLELRDGKLQKI